MTVIPRSEVKAADTWDLTPMYGSWAEWDAEFSSLEKKLPIIGSFRGTLEKSAEQIAEALRVYLDCSRALEKLYVFAHLNADADLGNAEHQGYLQRVSNLHARLAAEASFFTPELLSIDDEVLSAYLKEPVLAEFLRRLEEIVRYKPHTLSEKEEGLLAKGIEVFGAAQKIFSQLNNADLEFGSILVGDSEQALTHSTFITFLKSQDREVRRKAFEQYYGVFEQHKNSIAAALTSSIKKDVYFSSVREFDSALDGSLFSDNVNREVYEGLISHVSENLGSLHRYYDLRNRLLGYSESFLYDTYTSLVNDVEISHSYEDACKTIIESLEPLGSEYTSVLEAGFSKGRWVDRYENQGKRSGAYQSGCYDGPPYMLMNFKERELGDVFTLAHEAGHAMHTYSSVKNQPYQDHGYTIFVAEVASTFNEQLLMRRLKEKHANDPRVLAFLINQQIDDIKSTFFRQTMFAEFELKTHECAEKNEPLTVDSYRAMYRTLLEKYFGTAVTLGELDDLEGFRIPHFYSAFYVYKYATGLASAISLSRQVLAGEDAARANYLEFLSRGCTKYPLDLLKDAGVDLHSKEPITDTIKLFDSLVDELDSVLE